MNTVPLILNLSKKSWIDFRNMQLGFNIAYLPSFSRLSDGIRDRTFTFGLSLGYKLGTEKTGTIRSVRRHK